MKYTVLKLTAFSLLILSMISCHEKINGTSEKTFNLSRKSVEKELTAEEKINLEKAFRVIALKAMVLKWDEPAKYKNKSFNDISLEIIDGETYSSICDIAEDFLQEKNKKEAEKISTEIENLEKKKTKILEIERKLNLFKIGHLFLDETETFEEKCPNLEIEFVYVGKTVLKGPVGISYELKEKTSKKILSSGISIYGDEDQRLNKNESLNENLILCQAKEKNPSLFKNIKYPIENPNLSDFNMELKISVLSLYLNGEKIIKPKTTIQDLNLEIQEQKNELKQISNSKGTLDELELTEN